jgi:hypothetical protein
MRSDQILLEQFPEVEEDLRRELDVIGTAAGAESVKERRIKLIVSNIQAEV